MKTFFLKIIRKLKESHNEQKKEIDTTITNSRYNSEKYKMHCQICKYRPINKTDVPLQIHHIKFQCSANENGMIDHTHKHDYSNLVDLCPDCHQQVHKNMITIEGFVDTLYGKILMWSKNYDA